MKFTIEKIRTYNSVILFFFLIAAGIILLVQGILLVVHQFPKPVDDGIGIVTGESAEEIKRSVNYRALLRDTYVFSLESNAIELSGDVNFKASMVRYESAPVNQKTVNFYFVSGEGKKETALLAQDSLIVAYHFINDSKANGFLLGKNIYAIAISDTNNDDRLSTEDRIDLYVSDYNGLNIVPVGINVYGYTLVDDNKILFTEVSDNKEYFKIYYCKTGNIEEIFSTAEVPENKEFSVIFY